jgi:mono/diheme cytochrome c family protein
MALSPHFDGLSRPTAYAILSILLFNSSQSPVEVISMSRLLRVTPIFMLLLVAACGTVATPVWSEQAQGTQAALAVTSEHETAVAPTATLPPPTATPTDVPPTATSVSATATTEPTSEPATATTVPPTASPVPAVAAPSGDAANGKVLFETFYDQVSFACATCHHVDSEDRLIGPGLLNISTRAATRVEGEDALEYIHISIVNPSAFVVPDYPDGLMPQVYEQILSEAEIQDIIAYLFTLK